MTFDSHTDGCCSWWEEGGRDALPSSEMLAYGCKAGGQGGQRGGTAWLPWEAWSWATLLMQKLPQNTLKLPSGAFHLEADGLPWASHLEANALP